MAKTSLIMALPDPILVIRRDGRIVDSLGGRTMTMDLAPDAIVGSSIDDSLPRGMAALLRRLIVRVLKTREPECEEIAEGKQRFELRVSAHGRERILLVLRDISTGWGEGAASGLIHEDLVTGLIERQVFLCALDAALSRARLSERSLTLLCLSLREFDDLKQALDPAGREAVQRVAAQRMLGLVGSLDVMHRLDDGETPALARIGDGEFAMLFSDAEGSDILEDVTSLLKAPFSQPLSINGEQLSVTPQMGIATFPRDGKSGQHLLRNALAAMHEAVKLERTGIERYTDTLRLRTARQTDISEEMRWAIEEQQFCLHYQPVFVLAQAAPVAIEAFLRWHHPLRGIISAGEFLPLAEAAGEIGRISEWVLARACKDLLLVREATGARIVVSVNLSRQYFSQPTLIADMTATFERLAFDPRLLQLDVTERMLMRADHAGPLLAQLKGLGIGLQIDDFGSGFTSLKQLKRYPLDALKIAGDFTAGIGRAADDEAVCRSVIAMAHAYGMRCIAEAIENPVQVAFLREAGCDEVQGDLFGAAMTLDDVIAFLRQFADSRRSSGTFGQKSA